MLHDVSDPALGPAAQSNAGARRFREERKQDGTIAKLLGVD
jgi:hypothetical protein